MGAQQGKEATVRFNKQNLTRDQIHCQPRIKTSSNGSKHNNSSVLHLNQFQIDADPYKFPSTSNIFRDQINNGKSQASAPIIWLFLFVVSCQQINNCFFNPLMNRSKFRRTPDPKSTTTIFTPTGRFCLILSYPSWNISLLLIL